MHTRSRSGREILQEVFHAYQREHGGEPYRMEEVAAWGLHKGLLHPPRTPIVKLLAAQLRRAARDEYISDPQGRRVRRNHARREECLLNGELKQLVFWDDIYTAKPEHMRVSFQQRRSGVLYDCKQLQLDMESWNENNPHGAPPMVIPFNFEPDLAELKEPIDYPEARPFDEEDDDEEEGDE